MKYDVECFIAFWQCVFYLLTDKLIYNNNNLRNTTVWEWVVFTSLLTIRMLILHFLQLCWYFIGRCFLTRLHLCSNSYSSGIRKPRAAIDFNFFLCTVISW